jgi:capsular exopolysaccharide synthesis family protein
MRSQQGVTSSFSTIQPRSSRGDIWPVPDFSTETPVSLACYWRVLLNRRWIVMAIAAGIFLTVLFATVRQKPVYRASGSLEVDMPKSSVASVGELFQDQAASDNYLQTQAEILHSGVIVAKEMALLGPGNQMESEPDKSSLADFQARLSVVVLKGTGLIQVNYESESPEQAAKVVNQLMSLYIEQGSQERTQTAQSASSWLLNQLTDTKTKLEQATLNLQRYEEDHRLLFVNTKEGVSEDLDTERLQQLQADLSRAQSLRIEKETRNEQAQAGDVSVLQSPVLDAILKKETELNQQLSQLTAKFGANFPEVKQAQEQLDAVRADEVAERKLAVKAAAAEFEAASRQEGLARQAFESQQKLVGGAAQQLMQDGILKRDVDLDKQLYEGLLRQMNEAGLSSKLETSSSRIVELAQLPTTRIRPIIAYNLILGAFAGLTLGIGFALFQEHLHDTFQSEEDVEMHLNLPLLALIPAVAMRNSTQADWTYTGRGATLLLEDGNGGANPRQDNESWFRLDRDSEEHFELSEAIRNLRTSLLFAMDGARPQSILISSALPSEGKTTISANLSVALAQLGKRVLSIDGDLRRPSIHRFFAMTNGTGLADYLQGSQDWRKIVHPSGVKGLSVIVSGGTPRNPAELLSSERMRELIQQARAHYDVVIVDSPTLLHMADSRVLASYVEAVVLVVKSGFTPRKLVQQAFANVRSVSARVVGVVLNQVDLDNEEYSYPYSSYSSVAGSEQRVNLG